MPASALQRDLHTLAAHPFDVVVVGGGIFGACAAWDAALRGLSVALVERGDFCQATSANHFKIVHGGIRYLQHLDLPRLRESSRERNVLLRIAPHLVHPLPIAIPTYGHGLQGKAALLAGLTLYNGLAWGRNRGLRDPLRRVPWGHVLSRQECLRRFPQLEARGLTGAVVVYDGQMYNPPRLVLAFLRAAAARGAQLGNYLEATGLLCEGRRVCGVQVRDVLSGDTFALRARVVLNATGPWAPALLQQWLGLPLQPPPTFSRDACFVVGRRLLAGDCALAVPGRTRDPDAVLSRKQRHLFLVPWRDYTLVGVWHVVHRGAPDAFTVSDAELEDFIAEVRQGCPGLSLTLDDVALWQAGLVLFGDNPPGATDLRYGKRSRLIDHRHTHGLAGLLTLIGVRATVARHMAQKAIALVGEQLGRRLGPAPTATTPLYGGDIADVAAFQAQAWSRFPASVPPAARQALLRNYGTAYEGVLRYCQEDPTWAEPLPGATVLRAEVIHAVREEMACKLSDVVFRRTDLGTGAWPQEAALQACAALMARELGWSPQRQQQELDEVREALRRRTPASEQVVVSF
ncbi:MAG: glycerol-3-phosphate dehydrogenase [Candidatus Tectimicrobiota bacterium]|nr:MAG: glycerol-3-phosphate dehydrogenase [Candidatus Tectomicrobia bacterium]